MIAEAIFPPPRKWIGLSVVVKFIELLLWRVGSSDYIDVDGKNPEVEIEFIGIF